MHAHAHEKEETNHCTCYCILRYSYMTQYILLLFFLTQRKRKPPLPGWGEGALLGRDYGLHNRFRRSRLWYGGAMADLTLNPRENVPLAIQEAIRETLTVEEKALLAFFEADGFKNEMTKQEALDVLITRLIPPNPTPATIVLE